MKRHKRGLPINCRTNAFDNYANFFFQKGKTPLSLLGMGMGTWRRVTYKLDSAEAKPIKQAIEVNILQSILFLKK